MELDLGENNVFNISPLERLTDLRALNLQRNNVKDIGILKKMVMLGEHEKSRIVLDLDYDLDLSHNQIVDISSLVENLGINLGDSVNVSSNPLNSESIETYIPELECRGVELAWEPVIPIVKTTSPSTTEALPDVSSLFYVGIFVGILVLILVGYYIRKGKRKSTIKVRKI